MINSRGFWKASKPRPRRINRYEEAARKIEAEFHSVRTIDEQIKKLRDETKEKSRDSKRVCFV